MTIEELIEKLKMCYDTTIDIPYLYKNPAKRDALIDAISFLCLYIDNPIVKELMTKLEKETR